MRFIRKGCVELWVGLVLGLWALACYEVFVVDDKSLLQRVCGRTLLVSLLDLVTLGRYITRDVVAVWS